MSHRSAISTAPQHLGQDVPGQVRRVHCRQAAALAPGRRAHRLHDVCLGHLPAPCVDARSQAVTRGIPSSMPALHDVRLRYDPPPMNSQGGPIATVDLTTTVLRTAVARMDQLAENADAAELEMRLIALVRAAVTKWRARRPGEQRVATAVPEESMPLFEALGELDDNRREVLTLVELLGQEPERAGRLLGCDAKSVEAQRDESLESLWRAMNQAPPDQSVSTWDRLTVDTALRRAAAEWIAPAEAVLGYVGEQLFGEAPVGVPATVPARGAAAKAPAGRKSGRGGRRAVTAVPAGAVVTAKTAAAAAAPLAEGAASGPGTGAPAAEAGPSPAAAKAAVKLGPAAAKAGGSAAAAADGSPGRAAEVEPGQDGPWRAIVGLILFLRGRWAAWGIAAAAAR